MQNQALQNPRERLLSLDALRGFDMFWITGGSYLVAKIAEYSGNSGLLKIAGQMYHPEWAGFVFYDLIFPLFMFISGVAIPFALVSKLEKSVAKSELAKKALKRALILVVLGLIYNGALGNGFGNPRFSSVLGQIGLAYLFAALIVIYSKSFKCWTTPFNLLTGGISFVLLATFYWVIDVKGWKKWSFFFRVIGMNSIFIYLLYDLADIWHTTNYLLGWTSVFGDFGLIIHSSGAIALVWGLLYYMYKKNIFLKV